MKEEEECKMGLKAILFMDWEFKQRNVITLLGDLNILIFNISGTVETENRKLQN